MTVMLHNTQFAYLVVRHVTKMKRESKLQSLKQEHLSFSFMYMLGEGGFMT